MLEFLLEYGLFLAKVVTFVLAFMVIVGFVVASTQRDKGRDKGRIQVTRLNERLDEMCQALKAEVVDEKILKEEEKKTKKAEKLARKEKKRSEEAERRKRVYVLDFHGDVKASATDELRESITAILSLAEATDEVVVRLESPGGLVHGYGLAASQLARITQKSIPLTVCVDKVAASGGYMMACVADKIVAAPFAVLGSIGVVAQLPNFHKVLKKHNVDYEIFTAGEYKRTVTMLGENTEKGRRKFMDDLEETHILFKEFVGEHRAAVNVDEVATGEIWYGRRALEKNLIDQISTSDEYLTAMHPQADIIAVRYEHKKGLQERIGLAAAKTVETAFERVLTRFAQRHWF